MGEAKLYKYLDFNGGLMMLHYGNLQFTNATQLNDTTHRYPSERTSRTTGAKALISSTEQSMTSSR